MNVGGIFLNVLGTLARGFLFGTGFTIAFGIVYLFGWPALNAEADHRIREIRANSLASPKDITLSETEEQKRDSTVTITGRATNTGHNPAYPVAVQANLFNHGTFVDQCSASLPESIEPGESRYFKILCSCGNKAPAEHDTFKVVVLSGIQP